MVGASSVASGKSMTTVAANFASCFQGSRLMQKANTRPCSFKRSVATSLYKAMLSPTERWLPTVNSSCEQFVLQSSHPLLLLSRDIIESGQMQQSVQQIQLNFGREVAVKNPRLSRGRLGADDDFTMLKCEHVGRARETAKFFVQRCHSSVARD